MFEEQFIKGLLNLRNTNRTKAIPWSLHLYRDGICGSGNDKGLRQPKQTS